MISYTLKCEHGHSFDSWFQSADAFDRLKAAGHVSCAVCGSTSVEKAIMAPRVTTARDRAVPKAPAKTPPPEMQDVLQKMKRHVEENASYVGKDFATEARAQHLGDAPERPIYGEAKPEDAKSLLEDGVQVLPLPFTPSRNTN